MREQGNEAWQRAREKDRRKRPREGEGESKREVEIGNIEGTKRGQET